MGILRKQSTLMLSRQIMRLFLLGISILIFTVACSRNVDRRATIPNQLTENCRVVQHEAGATCIPQNPQRVITLWMGTFRNTLALGIKPIASSWISGEPFPKHLQGKADGVENLGLFEPNLERLLVLKPDLILANTRLQNIYTQLAHIAPTVALDHPALLPPWKKMLEDTAKILDKEPESQELINQYWQRIENLKQALGDRRFQMQVSIATVDQTFGIYIYGAQHPTSSVLNDIGLQRPPSQNGDFFVKANISYENLRDIDGDILFLSYRGGEAGKEALEKLQQNPLWQKLKVVQQNRVYLVDSDHWYGFDILAMNAVIDDLFKYLVNEP